MITQEIQQVQQTIFIADYRLVLCNDEVFKTWRCFHGRSLLGVLFEHSTHWSNAVDRIRYAQAEDAAQGLDDFMKVARLTCMSNKHLQEAWDALMGIDKRHYVPTGFYALGDAYLISGKNPVYKDKVVLVEHRERTQINHWDWTISKSDCAVQPTIITNGDDDQGNLKRKAPSLNILS